MMFSPYHLIVAFYFFLNVKCLSLESAFGVNPPNFNGISNGNNNIDDAVRKLKEQIEKKKKFLMELKNKQSDKNTFKNETQNQTLTTQKDKADNSLNDIKPILKSIVDMQIMTFKKMENFERVLNELKEGIKYSNKEPFFIQDNKPGNTKATLLDAKKNELNDDEFADLIESTNKGVNLNANVNKAPEP